jgi:hypothetical protein
MNHNKFIGSDINTLGGGDKKDGGGEKKDGGEKKREEGMMIRRVVMNPKVMVKTRRVKERKMKSLFLDMSLSMFILLISQ